MCVYSGQQGEAKALSSLRLEAQDMPGQQAWTWTVGPSWLPFLQVQALVLPWQAAPCICCQACSTRLQQECFKSQHTFVWPAHAWLKHSAGDIRALSRLAFGIRTLLHHGWGAAPPQPHDMCLKKQLPTSSARIVKYVAGHLSLASQAGCAQYQHSQALRRPSTQPNLCTGIHADCGASRMQRQLLERHGDSQVPLTWLPRHRLCAAFWAAQ